LAELRDSAGTNNWEDVLVLYCQRVKEDDFKMTRMINNLCDKLRAQIADHRMLAQEFDASSGWVIIKDKTVDSAALFHYLYNEIENLGLE
ncbi:hypothetical protein Tco_0431936, partial [Tanacetum coccineum]